MDKRTVYRAVVALVGCVYITSGTAKLLSPFAAANLVSAFFGLSAAVSVPMTIALSTFEIVLGFAFVFSRFTTLFAFTSTLLLLSSIVVGLHFVSDPIDCGCFGNIVSTKTDGLFFGRNSFLLACSMYIMRASPTAKEDTSCV
jgi:uncharacterized membrane protein YphA (DoxX/SURF4 family)